MKKQKNNFVKTLAIIMFFTFNSIYSMGQSIPSYLSYSAGLTTQKQQVLHSLIYDEQTTAFVTSLGINIIGPGSAQVLDINASDFNSVNLSNPLLADVKLIRVRYNSSNDFVSALNMSGLSNISNLNCVLLLSSINATTSQLNGAFLNIPTSISTCYSISIPN